MDIVNGYPTGSIRVSFGYMSTLEDAQTFVRFIEKCFVEERDQSAEEEGGGEGREEGKARYEGKGEEARQRFSERSVVCSSDYTTDQERDDSATSPQTLSDQNWNKTTNSLIPLPSPCPTSTLRATPIMTQGYPIVRVGDPIRVTRALKLEGSKCFGVYFLSTVVALLCWHCAYINNTLLALFAVYS